MPAIAQLVEHLTVEACRNQMVPGSIPGGRISCRMADKASANVLKTRVLFRQVVSLSPYTEELYEQSPTPRKAPGPPSSHAMTRVRNNGGAEGKLCDGSQKPATAPTTLRLLEAALEMAKGNAITTWAPSGTTRGATRPSEFAHQRAACGAHCAGCSRDVPRRIATSQQGRRKPSATGTRTRVAQERTEYPNQLDYSGSC